MLDGLDVLMKHMAEKHPTSEWWGDAVTLDASGGVVSLVCQICGEELAVDESQGGAERPEISVAKVDVEAAGAC